MKFRAEIDVMPLRALLDPQGKAVTSSLNNINLSEISNVRIGKHISMEVDTDTKEQASEIVDKACKLLLHNPIMESYEFHINEIQ